MGALRVDVNCDMGESFGPYRLGEDESVLESISSANVACGFHAGDPRVMDETVRKAVERGVSVGAHPGFPDLVGFGRRDLKMSPDEARTDVLYQIGALDGFCRRHKTRLSHVKPHGQLNNLAFNDEDLARAIIAGVADYGQGLIVVAYGGWLAKAAEEAGLPVAHEIFADREYNPDGTLVSRKKEGAVIHDPDRVIERALTMVRERRVRAVGGTFIELQVDTICVHGDTLGAADLTARLRAAFEAAGVDVAPMAEVLSGQRS